MFGQDRDSLRRAYAEAWQRHRDGLPLDAQHQRIADVVHCTRNIRPSC
jgi:hypothetical protein